MDKSINSGSNPKILIHDLTPSDVGYTAILNTPRMEIWKHDHKPHVLIIYKEILDETDLSHMARAFLKVLKDMPPKTCIHCIIDYRKGRIFRNYELMALRIFYRTLPRSRYSIKLWRIAASDTPGWGGYLQVSSGTVHEYKLFSSFRDAWNYIEKHYSHSESEMDIEDEWTV